MFKKTGPCAVQNDEGVSLRIVHPEIIEYREKNKVYEIGLGYIPQEKIYIYASISMLSSLSNLSKLNDAEKKEIFNKIKEAAKLLEGNFEVV